MKLKLDLYLSNTNLHPIIEKSSKPPAETEDLPLLTTSDLILDKIQEHIKN
jgi:hypothetical protein